MKRTNRNWLGVLGGLALSLVCGCQMGGGNPAAESFRVMTYNIHHGEGLDGKVDLDRIAALIRRERADIVALQEVDKGVRRTDGRDLSAELAALTGLTCVFSNNFHFQGGEYGNAVLTRFPVVAATNTLYQMLRTNEQRGLLQVTLATPERNLIFMATHLDYHGDDAERLLNVSEIRALAGLHVGTPVIVCGDFNTTPESRVHQRMTETFIDTWEQVGSGDGWTYSASRPQKRIDYIWATKTGHITPLHAHVPTSDASDHLPLVVTFQFR